MRRLHDLAGELGLTVLVEVHDEAETARAVDLGAEVVGVNARNLKTLEVDPDTFARLAPLVPADRVLVAESGHRRTPSTSSDTSPRGRARSSSARHWSGTATPRRAVRAMTGLTA